MPQPDRHSSHSSRRARWGIFITTFAMGAGLVATGLTTWLSQRDASDTVAEARAHDVFNAVRRSLRDDGPPPHPPEDFDLAGVLGDFEEAGLRYVALSTPWGDVVAEVGEAKGKSFAGPEARFEPLVTRLERRVRIEGGLSPRRGGRGLRLVLEVEPVLAARLEAAALEHVVVSSIAAALLVGFAFVFWRMAVRADRAEAALARQRRLAALGEMSAVLGHELRNPLAALKGHAQLVIERLEPEHRAAKNAERVVTEAERIETLSSQILDFARTGAVSPEVADPGAMLRDVAEKIAEGRVNLDLARAPATWRFDRPRMEQVAQNLLKNAVQAGGDAAIEVSCEVEGASLLIRVRDRGPGFPPGEELAVFEPFRTHRIHGTGLGLAIAQRIVEAHGGSIGAGNAQGGGAVVEVRLPAIPAPAAPGVA